MFRIEIEPISATTSKMTVKKALREVVGDWDKKFVLVANSRSRPMIAQATKDTRQINRSD
jgi:hypothetical protein